MEALSIMSVLDKTGGGGGGSSDYRDLSNKPKINGTTLSGDKTPADLGINYASLNDKPKINGVEIANDKAGIDFGLIGYKELELRKVGTDWKIYEGTAEKSVAEVKSYYDSEAYYIAFKYNGSVFHQQSTTGLMSFVAVDDGNAYELTLNADGSIAMKERSLAVRRITYTRYNVVDGISIPELSFEKVQEIITEYQNGSTYELIHRDNGNVITIIGTTPPNVLFALIGSSAIAKYEISGSRVVESVSKFQSASTSTDFIVYANGMDEKDDVPYPVLSDSQCKQIIDAGGQFRRVYVSAFTDQSYNFPVLLTFGDGFSMLAPFEPAIIQYYYLGFGSYVEVWKLSSTSGGGAKLFNIGNEAEIKEFIHEGATYSIQVPKIKAEILKAACQYGAERPLLLKWTPSEGQSIIFSVSRLDRQDGNYSITICMGTDTAHGQDMMLCYIYRDSVPAEYATCAYMGYDNDRYIDDFMVKFVGYEANTKINDFKLFGNDYSLDQLGIRSIDDSYTKDEVNVLIAASQNTFVVDHDPTPEEAEPNSIYYYPNPDATKTNYIAVLFDNDKNKTVLGTTDINFSEYQKKEDNNLKTTNKTVVSAINELADVDEWYDEL